MNQNATSRMKIIYTDEHYRQLKHLEIDDMVSSSIYTICSKTQDCGCKKYEGSRISPYLVKPISIYFIITYASMPPDFCLFTKNTDVINA